MSPNETLQSFFDSLGIQKALVKLVESEDEIRFNYQNGILTGVLRKKKNFSFIHDIVYQHKDVNKSFMIKGEVQYIYDDLNNNLILVKNLLNVYLAKKKLCEINTGYAGVLFGISDQTRDLYFRSGINESMIFEDEEIHGTAVKYFNKESGKKISIDVDKINHKMLININGVEYIEELVSENDSYGLKAYYNLLTKYDSEVYEFVTKIRNAIGPDFFDNLLSKSFYYLSSDEYKGLIGQTRKG